MDPLQNYLAIAEPKIIKVIHVNYNLLKNTIELFTAMNEEQHILRSLHHYGIYDKVISLEVHMERAFKSTFMILL